MVVVEPSSLYNLNMIKIYRMWRLVRIVEKELFKEGRESQGTEVTTHKVNEEFCELHTVFGRKYTSMEGVKAAFMADKLKYIGLHKKGDEHVTGISAEGLKFSSLSGLLDELSGSIAHVPALVSLSASLIAIVVSIYALKQ